MLLYNARSQLYLPEGESDVYTCFLEEAMWRKIHDRMPEAKRIFASIRADSKTIVCALGHPVRGGLYDEEPLYIPRHILDFLELEGSGEEIEVEWITEEYAPAATKLVLKPKDPVFYQVNARDELEPVLTRYGILQVGTTFPVALEALDGLIVDMDVVRCEPADVVLMEGDEVELEFESETSAAAPAAAPAVEPFDGSILPPATNPEPQGNRLGGTVRPRLPDGRAWNPWRA